MSLPRNLQGLRSLWRALCVALHKTFSWTTPTTVYPKTDLPLGGASPQLAAYPNLALGDTLLSCLHFSSNGDIFFQRVIRQTKSSSDKGGEKKNFRKYKSKKKKKKRQLDVSKAHVSDSTIQLKKFESICWSWMPRCLFLGLHGV